MHNIRAAAFIFRYAWADKVLPLPQVAGMSSKKLRRSGRVSKSVPILLIGSDAEDRVFTEETHTVVLSTEPGLFPRSN